MSSALSIAPTDSSTAATTRTTASAAGAFALADLLGEFVGDEHGGIAALVSRHGTTTTTAAGVANTVNDPITPATPFRVGSISKPFVPTMILQLVDEGRVDLDEPLSTYLPNATVGADVTIRELLRHRSGLPNYTDRSDFIRDTVSDLTRRFSPAEILTYIETVPRHEPDQSFAYSNTNYILLGQVIEQLVGTDLNTALHERITRPLHLDATRFATGDNPTPQGLAAGWSAGIIDGDTDDGYASIASSAWVAGALVSTVGDLAQFLAALFAGQLISDMAPSASAPASPATATTAPSMGTPHGNTNIATERRLRARAQPRPNGIDALVGPSPAARWLRRSTPAEPLGDGWPGQRNVPSR